MRSKDEDEEYRRCVAAAVAAAPPYPAIPEDAKVLLASLGFPGFRHHPAYVAPPTPEEVQNRRLREAEGRAREAIRKLDKEQGRGG